MFHNVVALTLSHYWNARFSLYFTERVASVSKVQHVATHFRVKCRLGGRGGIAFVGRENVKKTSKKQTKVVIGGKLKT